MAHEHTIDAEYLSPSDGDIVEISGAGDSLDLVAILPCPECDAALKVSFDHSGEVEETGMSYPLDDAEVGLE